jgi:hypothetical protein
MLLTSTRKFRIKVVLRKKYGSGILAKIPWVIQRGKGPANFYLPLDMSISRIFDWKQEHSCKKRDVCSCSCPYPAPLFPLESFVLFFQIIRFRRSLDVFTFLSSEEVSVFILVSRSGISTDIYLPRLLPIQQKYQAHFGYLLLSPCGHDGRDAFDYISELSQKRLLFQDPAMVKFGFHVSGYEQSIFSCMQTPLNLVMSVESMQLTRCSDLWFHIPLWQILLPRRLSRK